MIGVSAMGICPIHKIDLMAIGLDETNLAPTCVKCKAAGEPKTGRLQTAQDPGEAFFNKGIPPITNIAPKSLKVVSMETTSNVIPLITPNVPSGVTEVASFGIGQAIIHPKNLDLIDIVGTAVAQLNHLPMPKDIKEFKKVQKVIKTLESLLEKQNG